ncbi:macro domain-containing protein [Hazenella coriacea]|uniref:O-acetyl-ADP-ribose deacetylase (Regulator of RNase III) n=1 Tax=Hazenella coriacea TaxID=1179467 RepID=A0A4R3LBU8_9BACL|nr:macro domain-containing protein [Hazenella coriacea]TCS95784.1 O-acetyl-ADP-ribose deacetylase (regulator of RNase III) [Hazenella coriacea]
MVRIHSGDLLKSDCTIIGHQCNCLGVMGAGIAKQIRTLYPEVYKADQNYSIPFGEKRLGSCSWAWVENQHVGKRLVFNLYGQHRYGRKGNNTVVHQLEQAFAKMMREIESVANSHGEEWIKIGLPFKIGAGLAGGDWNEIFPMIEKVSHQFHRDIYLYQLEL